MPVSLSNPFKDFSSADVKRDSRIQLDKIIPPVASACSPGQYVVDETVTDTFNRANGPGFQIPLVWREIQNTIAPPCNSVAISGNQLIEQYGNPALSTCVGGIREDMTPSQNWRVTATWGSQDLRAPGSNGPRMYLCAPISQTNPADLAPPINAVSFFCWKCEHSLTVPATYNFQLFAYGAALTALGAAFNTTAFGNGHTYALEVFCNGVTVGPASTTIRGLVDGVIRASVSVTPGNLPTGLPGCGVMFDQALGTPLNIASLDSWTAERLV